MGASLFTGKPDNPAQAALATLVPLEAFTLRTLPDLAHDVGYVEGPAGSIYLEEQDDVRRATMHFAVLSSLALSPTESAELISTTLAHYQ